MNERMFVRKDNTHDTTASRCEKLNIYNESLTNMILVRLVVLISNMRDEIVTTKRVRDELDRALMALMSHVGGLATNAHQILSKYVDLAKVCSQFQDEKRRPKRRK